jgi:inhibitor of cysteine peptidase
MLSVLGDECMAMTLAEGDNGSTISVRPAEEIVLRLRENPTTGYRWRLEGGTDSVSLETDTFDPAPNPRVGSGGVREFRFRAGSSGSGRLELRLARPWERDGAVPDRFSVDLQIRE